MNFKSKYTDARTYKKQCVVLSSSYIRYMYMCVCMYIYTRIVASTFDILYRVCDRAEILYLFITTRYYFNRINKNLSHIYLSMYCRKNIVSRHQ